MLKNFEINKTINTPAIQFLKIGILYIVGRSIPNNANEFYKPVVDSLIEFVKLGTSIEINIELDYIDSASYNMILKLLKILINANVNTIITWGYCERDYNILKIGEEFEKLLGISFHYKLLAE